MLQVDPSLFANVILAVQRTSRLPGGSVSGLPNGVVIDGLQGVSSFGSDISEAQKDFEKGRIQQSLARVRQIESQFSGISGRWSSTVVGLISTAKQGRQQLPMQKLNEVKNAQSKMVQLTSPVEKAFRDLVSALEHAVTVEAHESEEAEQNGSHQNDTNREPESQLPEQFARDYQRGEKLRLTKTSNDRTTIEPTLKKNGMYFVAGLDPPSLLKVKGLQHQAVVFDNKTTDAEQIISSRDLKTLIRKGIWVVVPATPR